MSQLWIVVPAQIVFARVLAQGVTIVVLAQIIRVLAHGVPVSYLAPIVIVKVLAQTVTVVVLNTRMTQLCIVNLAQAVSRDVTN